MRSPKMIGHFVAVLLVLFYATSASSTVLGRLPVQRIKRAGYGGIQDRPEHGNQVPFGHQNVNKYNYQPGYQPGHQPGHQPGYQPGHQPGHQPGFQPEYQRDFQPEHHRPGLYDNDNHRRPIGGDHEHGRYPDFGSPGRPYDYDYGVKKGHNYGGHNYGGHSGGYDGAKGYGHEHRYRRSPHHDPAHGEPGHEHDPGHGEPGHVHDPGHGEPGHVHDPGHGEPGHVHVPAHGEPGHVHDPGHGEPGHVHDPGHGEPGHVHKHEHGPNHSSDESKSSEEKS